MECILNLANQQDCWLFKHYFFPICLKELQSEWYRFRDLSRKLACKRWRLQSRCCTEGRFDQNISTFPRQAKSFVSSFGNLPSLHSKGILPLRKCDPICSHCLELILFSVKSSYSCFLIVRIKTSYQACQVHALLFLITFLFGGTHRPMAPSDLTCEI